MNREALAIEAARFLNDHLTEAITVQDLADHLAWSPAHLTRTFTATVGTSPIRYLAAQRFQAAKRLLVVEQLSVLDACHEVGFTSVGTFTRRFTSDVGLAPGQFRRAADRVSEIELGPVSLWQPGLRTRVRVRVDMSPDVALGPLPYQWVGTFPTPVPSGPPVTGTLRRGVDEVELPFHPAAPWLLVMVTPSSADIGDHLWPSSPLVARHPVPLTGCEGTVTLRPGAAEPWNHPVLVALAALYPRI